MRKWWKVVVALLLALCTYLEYKTGFLYLHRHGQRAALRQIESDPNAPLYLEHSSDYDPGPAGHASHASHASHQSHRSHYSSR